MARSKSLGRRIRWALAGTALIGGAGLLAAWMAPRALVPAAERLLPGCLYDVTAVAGVKPAVALTIDDAPDQFTTAAILDTLRAHGARATFFVITSQVESAEPVVARIVREGHEIGNHFTLDRPSILLDSAAFDTDLAIADSVLSEFGPVEWVRPGSGWYTARMVRSIERTGDRCAVGSVYPLDAGLGWPWLSEKYILSRAYPGAIIVLHDRGARGRRTARVLGRVLPRLRARGYDVVALRELRHRE